jgi:hypothetical protein
MVEPATITDDTDEAGHRQTSLAPQLPAVLREKQRRRITASEKWYSGAKEDRDSARKQRLLLAFAEVGIVATACRFADVHPSMHYKWLQVDPVYAEAFRCAQKSAVGALEQAAWTRAVEGQERVDKDGNVYRQYSDLLLMFLIKQRDNSYRDNVRQDVNVNVSGHIEHTHTPRLERLSAQQWLGLAAAPGMVSGQLPAPDAASIPDTIDVTSDAVEMTDKSTYRSISGAQACFTGSNDQARDEE